MDVSALDGARASVFGSQLARTSHLRLLSRLPKVIRDHAEPPEVRISPD